MIREATKKDIPFIFPMLAEFFQYAKLDKWGLSIDGRSLIGTMIHLIEDDHSVLYVLEINGDIVGTIAGTNAGWYANYKQFKAQELWYWVCPKYRKGTAGIKLLNALIDWAKEMNATSLMMISLPNKQRSKIERLYKRKGFTLTEKIYERKF